MIEVKLWQKLVIPKNEVQKKKIETASKFWKKLKKILMIGFQSVFDGNLWGFENWNAF